MSHIMEREECRQVSLYIYYIYIAKHIQVDDHVYIYTYNFDSYNNFQGYGEKCSPKGQCTFGPRLQDDEIKMLAEFVKSQAESGWPKVESYED